MTSTTRPPRALDVTSLAAGRRPGEVLRFGFPRGGRLEEPTDAFLTSCGLRVLRASERQLTATMSGMPGVTVVLQRHRDVMTQVADGRADVGITGLDTVLEHGAEHGNLVVLHEDLGFAGGQIVVEVPDSWLDVSTLADLAEIAIDLRERGERLRVATSYPNLARQFFYEKGITHFSLVQTEGGVEASVTAGFADVVVDIVSSGVTLRENRLKMLRNSVILRFSACIIGNKRSLAESAEKREALRRMLERMEARRQAEHFYSVTANLRGRSEREVASALLDAPATHGRSGPTVARVYTPEDVAQKTSDDAWFAATIIVESTALQDAVDHLRSVGGVGISVLPLNYLFDERSQMFGAALTKLGVRRG